MVVLIVEDEAIVALMLEAELRDAGYYVLGPAVTAREALQLARTTHVDFALLDINLQDGSSGIDLARELRDSFGTVSVFISGEAEQAHANRDAAVAYIRKPYEFATVLAALRIARRVAEGRTVDLHDVPHGVDVFARPVDAGASMAAFDSRTSPATRDGESVTRGPGPIEVGA